MAWYDAYGRVAATTFVWGAGSFNWGVMDDHCDLEGAMNAETFRYR